MYVRVFSIIIKSVVKMLGILIKIFCSVIDQNTNDFDCKPIAADGIHFLITVSLSQS